MRKLIWVPFLLIFFCSPVLAAEGMINVSSAFSVTETANRLDDILRKKGMTVFNRVKHSEAAGGVGIELRDTELIIFGTPKVGSPLMKCKQSVAIDLPQKFLIWRDEGDKVWISYNDPAYLVKRHRLSGCDEVIVKVGKALAGLSKAAATK